MEPSSKYVSGNREVQFSLLSIRKLFVGAIIAGGLLIFASVFWGNAFFAMLFPLTVMAVYISITLKGDVDLPKALIGDSYYYLGFIFTLIALVASLLTLGDGEISIGSVVGSFGAALLTTVVGLTARLIITTFSAESADHRERLEQEIEKSLDRFTVQVETMTTRVVQSVTTIASETDSALKKNLALQDDTRKKFTDLVRKATASIEHSVGDIDKRLSQIKIDPDIITKNVTNAFQGISDSLTSAVESQQALNNAIHGSLKQIDMFNAHASKAVLGEISSSTAALNKSLSKQAEIFKESLDAIANSVLLSLGDVKDIKEGLQEQWQASIKTLNDETGQLSQTVQKTHQALQTIQADYVELAKNSSLAQSALIKQIDLISEEHKFGDIIASLHAFSESVNASSLAMAAITNEARESQRSLLTTVKTIDATVVDVQKASEVVRDDISNVYKQLTTQIEKISK